MDVEVIGSARQALTMVACISVEFTVSPVRAAMEGEAVVEVGCAELVDLGQELAGCALVGVH